MTAVLKNKEHHVIHHIGTIGSIAHFAKDEKEWQELWKLHPKHTRQYGSILAATIQGINKYMLTTELDVLLDNDTIFAHEYDNILTEETATITMCTIDCFLIPIHIEVLIPDAWYEDQKCITIHRQSSQLATPHMNP
eukprot:8924847-Ditylum_brightwellii.AAC.1